MISYVIWKQNIVSCKYSLVYQLILGINMRATTIFVMCNPLCCRGCGQTSNKLLSPSLFPLLLQFASCYASVQPLQLFGKGPRGGNYLSLLTYRGPHCTPRPRLTCGHAPKMTLRQICRLLKLMKQVRNKEAAAAAAASRWRTILQ